MKNNKFSISLSNDGTDNSMPGLQSCPLRGEYKFLDETGGSFITSDRRENGKFMERSSKRWNLQGPFDRSVDWKLYYEQREKCEKNQEKVMKEIRRFDAKYSNSLALTMTKKAESVASKLLKSRALVRNFMKSVYATDFYSTWGDDITCTEIRIYSMVGNGKFLEFVKMYDESPGNDKSDGLSVKNPNFRKGLDDENLNVDVYYQIFYFYIDILRSDSDANNRYIVLPDDLMNDLWGGIFGERIKCLRKLDFLLLLGTVCGFGGNTHKEVLSPEFLERCANNSD